MNTNKAAHDVWKLFSELVDCERQILKIDADIKAREAQNAQDQLKAESLVERQEELTTILHDGLVQSGPVLFADGYGDKWAVAADPGESVLAISKLGTPTSVVVKEPAAFDPIVEAAFHAAAEDVLSDVSPWDMDKTHVFPSARPASIASGVAVIDQEAS